jgi:mRNA interferase MazF
MRRGEVWWASLPEPRGSEPGYRRPVLIVQADSFTESRIRTVVIVAITTNLHLAMAPGNVELSRRATRLRTESVANVSQIMTIDKSFLTDRISTLPPELLRRVERGMRLVLSL